MNKLIVGILIVCLYSFPFVYFSMYQDFTNRSMLGYLIMLIVTLLLAFFGKFFDNTVSVVIGNILSAAVSFYFIREMDWNDEWGVYFKPLTTDQLLIFVSVLNTVPQLFAMKLANKLKHRATDKFKQNL